MAKLRPIKPGRSTISGNAENRMYAAVRSLHDSEWAKLRPLIVSWISQAMGADTLKAKRFGVSQLDTTAHLDPEAKRFIVSIDGEIEAAGLRARVSTRQKDAGEWDIRNTSIYDQINRHVIKLAESTVADIKAETIEEARRVVSDIQQEVLAGQQSGENMQKRIRRIEQFFSETSRWKARRIAVTEASRAANWGYLAATADADWIVGYEWLLSANACAQCKAVGLVGGRPRRVKKGSPFGTGMSRDEFYATIMAPPLHPGCLCTLTGIIDDDVPSEWDTPVAAGPDGRVEIGTKGPLELPRETQLLLLVPSGDLEMAMAQFDEKVRRKNRKR
jgi:hypothetical protein